MATKIQLHHIGEVVLAGLLRELGDGRQLGVPCVLHKDCRLSTVLEKTNIGWPIEFSPNVPLAPVRVGNQDLQFDGAHGIDVLCSGPQGWGLAIEAKLGHSRMASGVFNKRFLKPVSYTSHSPKRIKGGMVAILNHRALFDPQITALSLWAKAPSVEIVRSWFLVIRRNVWMAWRDPTKRPSLADNAHVVIFEDIVERYGNMESFNKLVHCLVGSDFYQSWGLGPAT